jgi:hypothetical protein
MSKFIISSVACLLPGGPVMANVIFHKQRRREMARFRAETVLDPNSGKYYVELYYPDNATEPLVTTDPIYPSHEVAEQETLRLMQEALPTQPVKK